MMSPVTWIPASRRRRFLAVGVDLMLFSAGWGVFEFCARYSIPALADLPVYVRGVIFLVVESALYREIGRASCRERV